MIGAAGKTGGKAKKAKQFIKPENLASSAAKKAPPKKEEQLSVMLLDDLNEPMPANPYVALREEDQVRTGYQNALVQLAANLGHSPPSAIIPGGADPLEAPYHPGLRWRQALDDLHGLLLPADGAPPPEPLLECLAGTQLWERHLCPLFLALEPGGQTLRLLQCMAAINGPLAELTDPAEHVHRRRGWKRSLAHGRLQLRLVETLVWGLEEGGGGRGDRGQAQLLIRTLLTLLRNALSCPDAPPPQPSGQERLLRAMQQSRLLELLGLAAGSLNDWPFADLFPLILELWSLIFGWIHPDSLLPAAELQERPVAAGKPVTPPIRHSRFMGTICVQMEDGRQRVYNQARFHELTQGETDRRRKRTRPAPKVALLDWPRLIVGSGVRQLLVEGCEQTLRPHLPLLMARVEADEGALGHLLPFHTSWLRLAAWLLARGGNQGDVEAWLTLIPVNLVQREMRLLKQWQEEKAWGAILALLLYLRAALGWLRGLEQHRLEYAALARSLLANLLLSEVGVLTNLRNTLLVGERRAGLIFHRVAIEVNGACLETLRHLAELPGTLSVRISGLVELEDEVEQEAESAVSRFTEFSKASREDYARQATALYAHSALLTALIPPLRRWEQAPVSLNNHLTSILEAMHTHQPALLWRVSLLHAAHRVLSGGSVALRQAHARLVELCEQVARGFTQQLAHQPLLLLQAFFPTLMRPSQFAPEKDEDDDNGGSIPALLAGLPKEQQIRQLVKMLIQEEEASSLVHWLRSHLETAILDPHNYLLLAETSGQRRALEESVSMKQLLRVIGAQAPGKQHLTFLA